MGVERRRFAPFVQRALEASINFFDTADVYSLRVSEEVIGYPCLPPERRYYWMATTTAPRALSASGKRWFVVVPKRRVVEQTFA